MDQVAGIISQDAQQAKEKKIPGIRDIVINSLSEVDNTPRND